MSAIPSSRAATEKPLLSLPPRPGTLTAPRPKVSLTLNAAELSAVPAPEGKPRVVLRIVLPGRTVTADVAAKSLRKAQTAIRDAASTNLVIMLQGHLVADAIVDAGLTTMPKQVK